MDYPCILCHQEVRPKQQALECDGCKKWQHRTCNTGISQTHYRDAVKQRQDIVWQCAQCQAMVIYCLCFL